MKCRSLGPPPAPHWLARSEAPRSNWPPLGMLLRVQWSSEKDAQAVSIFPLFLLLLPFSRSVHLYSVFTVGERTDKPPPPPSEPSSLPIWVPVYLWPITLQRFSHHRFFPPHFSHVFADKSLAICLHLLSPQLRPLCSSIASCLFFVAKTHSFPAMLREIVPLHLQQFPLCWMHTAQSLSMKDASEATKASKCV